MIHLSFFIRQLTSPKTRIFINHKWWHHFQVAGFFSFIEKEADKSPLQFCTFSLVNRKSCSCKFNAQIKINNIIFLNQIPVGESCFRNNWHDSTFSYLNIIISSMTSRNRFMRQVWKSYDLISKVIIDRYQFIGKGLDFFFKRICFFL